MTKIEIYLWPVHKHKLSSLLVIALKTMKKNEIVNTNKEEVLVSYQSFKRCRFQSLIKLNLGLFFLLTFVDKKKQFLHIFCHSI